MVFPDYKRSIVNVSSSLINAFGGKPLYSPLKELDFIRDYGKSVLLVIDGLGYEFLQNYGKNSFLQKNCIAKITSTFPTTTATAEVALETGVASQQHSLTGWNVLIKELGAVVRVLPFTPRFGDVSLAAGGVKRTDIFVEPGIGQKINIPSTTVLPVMTTNRCTGDGHSKYFQKLGGMVRHVQKSASLPGRRFIFAYWIKFDKISHKKGCASPEAVAHFFEIDKAINKLANFLKNKKTCLIVAADHGFVDVPRQNRIVLNDYREIYDCLVLPLSGDTRAANCYVRLGKEAEFKKLAKEQLGFCCDLCKGTDFIKRGVFGQGVPNSRLFERVGDYILVCKDGYLIRDLLLNEKMPDLIGYHGGMSEQEMFVPLIVAR